MLKAFVLGAGLGTRLRPLTDILPKPMVPYFHRPMIEHIWDHLLDHGVTDFVVNTHHLAQAYTERYSSLTYRGASLNFRHEPVLLETAGGLANVADLLQDGPFLVYNGDILTDLPIQPLMEAHRVLGSEVTLALRSHGPSCNVSFDSEAQQVIDLRQQLHEDRQASHQFTGVYMVNPEFLQRLTYGKKQSVVEIWLQMLRDGESIGAVVIDEGQWCDLGDRDSYLQAHADGIGQQLALAKSANLAASVQLQQWNVVGPHARIGANVTLCRCVVWPGAVIVDGAQLTDCVVTGRREISGTHHGVDL